MNTKIPEFHKIMGHADNVSKDIYWNCVILQDMLWTLLCRLYTKSKTKGGGGGGGGNNWKQWAKLCKGTKW